MRYRPEEDNYFSKGVKRNYISDKTAAEREQRCC